MRRRVALACCLLAAFATRSAAEVAGRLTLAGGGRIAGHWATGDGTRGLRWRAAFAGSPFEFPWHQVGAVAFPTRAGQPPAPADFQFELARGGLLFGNLLEVADDTVTVDAFLCDGSPPTRVEVRRNQLIRITNRRGAAGLAYVGPLDLSGWSAPDASAWRLSPDGLQTSASNATIWREVGLGDRTKIEVDLRWDGGDFSVAFGVPPTPKPDRPAPAAMQKTNRADTPAPTGTGDVRIEAVGGRLVVSRETASTADLAVVSMKTSGRGGASLVLYVDRNAGAVVVATPAGKTIAELQASGRASDPAGGVRITNRSGRIVLSRLAVSPWDGRRPNEVDARRPRILTRAGRWLPARLVGVDAAAGSLRLAGLPGVSAALPESLKTDEVVAVQLAGAPPEIDPPTIVVLQNGGRLVGTPLEVRPGALRFAAAALTKPISTPMRSVRGVRPLRSTPADAPAPKQGAARLVTETADVMGELTGGPANGRQSCLRWRPLGCRTAAALLKGVSGRIELRSAAEKVAEEAPTPRGRVPRAVVRGLSKMLGGPGRPDAPPDAVVFFRSGDKLPCRISAIDGDTVAIDTPFAATKHVRQQYVKAVELATKGVDGRVAKTSRERLLTLPRARRDYPPTHLLVSKAGDYLRCRLNALDAASASVQIRMREQQIDRSRVARIIWLDPPPQRLDEEAAVEAAQPDSGAASATVGDDGPLVQAVAEGGVRLTFRLAKLETGPGDRPGWLLRGVNRALGECTVPVAQIDTLLLGEGIRRPDERLTYSLWKMVNAISPRDDNPGGAAGERDQQSPLIGQPAPDLTLPWVRGDKVVDEDPMRVADFRGEVLVLDFWASWCGPCLRAMPVIDQVGRRFAGRGVTVIAINLRESPAQVQPVLERLQIEPLVALDRDGSAAERYGVRGIPQTVVIDPRGRVASVLIGAGGGLEGELRAAIDDALEGRRQP